MEQITYLLGVVLFVSIIFIHLSKKSSTAILLYAIQSAIIAVLLFLSAFGNGSLTLVLVAAAIFAVKVVFAPWFLHRLILRHQLKFTSSTYLNAPLTLIVITLLAGMTFSSDLLKPLTALSEMNGSLILIAVAMMLISVFLIINRKGALSQMIGILSLENSIVFFAFVAGLEQAPVLEVGIIFDILVWIIIATVFASMVFRQFGTLDVSEMNNLKEE
jgi:hydrogenase-4 component E